MRYPLRFSWPTKQYSFHSMAVPSASFMVESSSQTLTPLAARPGSVVASIFFTSFGSLYCPSAERVFQCCSRVYLGS
jgi:hypothetical protein